MPVAHGGPHEWSRERTQAVAARICDPARVLAALEAGRAAGRDHVRDLLHHARSGKGLTPAEAAVLLQVEDPGLRAEIMAAARETHERSYGRRIGLMTPLCPSNRCANDCLYCPLRRSNARLKRTTANARELQREVLGLLDEGYRHICLVFGEDRSGVHYLRDMVWAAYGARSGLRQLQRVDLNANPMRLDELRELQEIPRLGAYHVFQETYDPDIYRALHPDGPKADYPWRLTCHDRAHDAGISDVGLGVLLGAGDWLFDVVALLSHAEHLAREYGRAPYAITYPRMIAAPSAPASASPRRPVDDALFCFIVAVTRLALPRANIALVTPASRETRVRLYEHGISQVSVGSSSYPGVYTADGDPEAAGSLEIGRPRALEVLVYRMCEAGFVANFCESCHGIALPAQPGRAAYTQACVLERCAPNALLALKEYLVDHASAETALVCGRLIQERLALLPEGVRSLTLELMEEIEAGLRRQTI